MQARLTKAKKSLMPALPARDALTLSWQWTSRQILTHPWLTHL